MKLTTENLKELIKEELKKINEEGYTDSQKEAMNATFKKTLQRLAKLEKQVDFLMKTYQETSSEDFEARRKRFAKTKSQTALQEGDKND